MTTLLHIERQAWLVSVALHTVITLGFVWLVRDSVIDERERFRLELVLVEKGASVLTAVEAMVGSAPTHADNSSRRTKIPKDTDHRPVGLQAPRPVIESKLIEPELQEQPTL